MSNPLDKNGRVGHDFPPHFERQARLPPVLKLYELGKVSTGMGARLAGMGRVAFMFELGRYGLSPIGVEPEELEQDAANA